VAQFPLNLNDEVVRMRKEVKRVRALVIRKLTRQMAGLKKKKGKEEDLERNRRRVGRLLEEIHAMKTLKPDPVTKAALHKNLSFEFACKNPKATISDRAIARIATHPQFSKKIDTIKAAIKAFKDERMSVEKGDQKETEEDGTPADEEEDGTPVESLTVDEPAVLEKQPVDKTVRVTEEDDVSTIENKESAIENTTQDPKPQKVTKPQNKDVKNKQDDEEDSDDDHEEEESDLESSDDEKEYFDDSTEERFRKQSSQSDESDNDDFFLGKVNKFKKKREGKSSELGKNPLLEPLESLNPHHTELDELEARLNSKGKSIFCSSLSGSRGGRGRGRGGGRGRGADFGRQREGRGFSSTPSSQPPQQALHPSWEASKKRKEQQNVVVAFQGKKIKFDD
uniref:Serum response factor-binding protein 1 n=1 Tax=Oncorhynchus tshawytscha TaxID=74940 RepID=A0AAZ3Q4C6_ONCTS